MKIIRILSENFQFLFVKFLIYLNRSGVFNEALCKSSLSSSFFNFVFSSYCKVRVIVNVKFVTTCG